MTCIKMGSDESHFNVSLIVRDKVTRQCPQTTTFTEKGEPKWYRTKVLPLTSLTPYTVTTRMTCIKMGSDESHFNVSLIVRDKVTRQCPQTTTFTEKGEPKWYRTKVLPLTSLTPYTVTTRMTCIKMGSDESHFNVSLIVRDKVTRPCPQTTTFEKKGELKQYRSKVLPLTSLTP